MLVHGVPRRSIKPIVAYVRINTRQPGGSGPDIEAEQEVLARFACKDGFEVATQFIKVEAGKESGPLIISKVLPAPTRSWGGR